MKRLKTFNENFNQTQFVPPDLNIVKKYLGIFEDIFSEVEDEMGISLEIIFYEFDPSNPKNYKTIDSLGKKSTFWTEYRKEYGYFTISYYESNVKHVNMKESKTVDKCIERVYKVFDHQIDITKEIDFDFMSLVIHLKEPLV